MYVICNEKVKSDLLGSYSNAKHSYRGHRSESVMSTDSDIRFTRRKLGENERCGCALIAGFLATLLLAGAIVYIGYTYFRPDPLPDRVFRARFRVIKGDTWQPELADQNSLRFQHLSRDYRERINLVLRRSDLRAMYEGCEILALDGIDDQNDLTVHFILHFDPYRGLVSAADLHAIFTEEFEARRPRYFNNITIDLTSLDFQEMLGNFDDISGTSSSPLGRKDDIQNSTIIVKHSPRRCEPVRLLYCRNIGYNLTTYPNLLGHMSFEEVEQNVIAFRELVDAECFRQAFDFVCRLLQPPCEQREPLEPQVGQVCRRYCQEFLNGCGNRLPKKFRKYFNCERFPESTGSQTCRSRPECVADLQSHALSSRLCDGIADCPDLSDEITCSFCPENSLYCGRGRACISRRLRCDGKADCPDGSDEMDCLSIAPLVSHVSRPVPLTPHRNKFYNEGFAIFSEKGITGKLCAEGLDSEKDTIVRNTVAESLCKALGYQNLLHAEVRSDNEPNITYVRVFNPRTPEISFVRTNCRKRLALYLKCDNLECGVQSLFSGSRTMTLSKMSAPGDWPWHVSLYRSDIHVCDGTLVSDEWVLTTEGCFQGQSKATWMAVFGSVRLSSSPPWMQRRRIIGMVKSPVEGSTAALIRLETPVQYSDFVRPVCLPDDIQKNRILSTTRLTSGRNRPQAEKLKNILMDFEILSSSARRKIKVNRDYFSSPANDASGSENIYPRALHEEFEEIDLPKAESLNSPLFSKNYPLPNNSPQTLEYEERSNAFKESQYSSLTNPSIAMVHYANAAVADVANTRVQSHHWTNCNTLGWARQRDHLQRVQLKIGDMEACENVSIATVNSMCTETAYHKQDCMEEEFAGSPVLCLLPDNKRWALVGIASWRIACAISGTERPRMYDKISSNSAWIRDIISAT
ncbi:uncharacterized protein LOC129805244 [Phlebotomus papatasi]|uniref:uncharacterized protein LOC129805244 n=1 Tax=Phlebotomus papatasi TaxID=29031 RepID=UPI002483FAB4|nr:uncharacterized protein LOC129805244 [Phlebotomus papatasi]